MDNTEVMVVLPNPEAGGSRPPVLLMHDVEYYVIHHEDV